MSTAFSRSSNSPRYFAPATSAAHVERDDLLVLQALGHVLPDDPLRQPFDDGRLADAGLADQHRVVLGAAREDLDDAADLLVAADDRIELALARELGQVAAVLLERLIRALGILRGHALVAADRRQRLEDRVLRRAELTDRIRAAGALRPLSPASASSRCSVLTYSSFRRSASASGRVRHLPQARRQPGLRPAVGARQLRQLGADRRRDGRRIDVHLPQDLGDDAALLFDQREQHVLRRDFRDVLRGRRAAARRRSLPVLSRCISGCS